MSFSVKFDLPSIKIPNINNSALPNHAPHLAYLPNSTASNLSNISEVCTPPTVCSNSPSTSYKQYTSDLSNVTITNNIFSPSMDQTSPISMSYTINAFQFTSPVPVASTPTSKSSKDIICNTPNTINNILSKTRRRGHGHTSRHKRGHYSSYSNNNNKSHHNHNHSHNNSNASLQLSETPLTPTPKQDITFNFDSVDTTNGTNDNYDMENEEKNNCNINHTNTNTNSNALSSNKTLHVLVESEDNVTDIETEISAATPKEKIMSVTSNDDSKSSENETTNQVNVIVSEDEATEQRLLNDKGYQKVYKITDTLQGSVFVSNTNTSNGNGNDIVVIKRTSKYLHAHGITIQNGKEYKVNENVIKEYSVLKHFSLNKNCPSQITKAIDFFESEYNYYLVMENGGKDFFDFIVKAHQLINEHKLKVKEWRKFVKYMFYQMVIVVQWLHNQMSCCHLDISLENITVLNGNFIAQKDGYYTINPNIKIKFVDFGLAEFFDPIGRFECVKYCGKTAYKAPEIYRAKRIFDARKADVWSLGVVLFCMAIGSPPYVKPSNSDDAYKYFIKTQQIEKLLFQWNRHFCVTVKMLDLLKNMLKVDIKNRFLIENVLKHPWLNVYQKQYRSTYQNNQSSKPNINNIFNDQVTTYKLPMN